MIAWSATAATSMWSRRRSRSGSDVEPGGGVAREQSPIGVRVVRASSTWSRRPIARRSDGSCGPLGRRSGTGGLAEVGPASIAVVDVVEVEPGFVEERGEIDVRAVAAQRTQLVDLGRPPRRDRLAQAAQHDLGGHRVELHVAAGG